MAAVRLARTDGAPRWSMRCSGLKLAVGDDAQERAEDAVEIPGNVLREEAENHVALFLKWTVLVPITPVCDRICQVSGRRVRRRRATGG